MTPLDLQDIATKINEVLTSHSDKEWDYSRITLHVKPLSELHSPYVLICDVLNMDSKEGKLAYKSLVDETSWGDRHSNELGILEIISLRINKALVESAAIAPWGTERPFIRIMKKEDLTESFVTSALWYEVQEVTGEDFDSR